MRVVDNIFDRFENTRVLVLGDIMIDRYLEGNIRGISPEAPVPVLDHNSTDNRPGGAANVALNINSLGAQVTLCGIYGKDQNAEVFRSILEAEGLDTIGGLVFNRLGYLPKPGEKLELGVLKVVVKQVGPKRIEEVLVERTKRRKK